MTRRSRSLLSDAGSLNSAAPLILFVGHLHQCNHLGYILKKINSFKHKGLRKLFLEGIKSGVQPSHADRLRLVLSWLNASVEAKDMDLPGLHLHRLKGERKDTWSVWISGNWRVTFSFDGKDAIDVDYEDYR